jgi:hypothetical protein
LAKPAPYAAIVVGLKPVISPWGLSGGGVALHWVDVWGPRLHVRVHELALQLAGVSVQTMLAVHALLILSACWLAFSRGRWRPILAGIAVVSCSVVWFGVNGRWEGRTLYIVSPTHGVTQADLVAPACIAIAFVVRGLRYLGRAWLQRREQRRRDGVTTVFRIMWPKV